MLLSPPPGVQVSFVSGIGGRIYLGNRMRLHFIIHIHKGEDTGIRECAGHFLEAGAFNIDFNADRSIPGIDNTTGEIKLVTNSNGLQKIDAIDPDKYRPVGDDLFRSEERRVGREWRAERRGEEEVGKEIASE